MSSTDGMHLGADLTSGQASPAADGPKPGGSQHIGHSGGPSLSEGTGPSFRFASGGTVAAVFSPSEAGSPFASGSAAYPGPSAQSLVASTQDSTDAIAAGISSGHSVAALGDLGNSVVMFERLLATMPPNLGTSFDLNA
jgi:hypothetical protein